MDDIELTEDQIAASRILIVDDDELVTGSLNSFFALELEVDPIVFNESVKAAEYIAHHELDLIITDFLMPEMNGIELLRAARDHQPHVPRVLLTGYADKENAIKAINEVGVFQYIEKPWENDRLKRVVLQALMRLQAVRELTTTELDLAEHDNDIVVLREALLRSLQ